MNNNGHNKEFRYDPETRSYWLGDQRIPGHTSVLKKAGLYGDLLKWVTDRDRDRGKVAHLVFELDAQGELDEDSLDQVRIDIFEPGELRGFLEADRRFRLDYKVVTHAVEEPRVNAAYGYACLLDWYGEIEWQGRCRQAIVEKKIGGHLRAYEIQTAAQLQTMEAPHNWLRFGLHLSANGTSELRLHDVDSEGRYDPGKRARDFKVFAAALVLLRWRGEI